VSGERVPLLPAEIADKQKVRLDIAQQEGGSPQAGDPFFPRQHPPQTKMTADMHLKNSFFDKLVFIVPIFLLRTKWPPV
jgi:hypothetical protein